MANKLLQPQRWDMIVFRYPKDPTRKYMQRLVGLPGETVYLKGGSVWVNGQEASEGGPRAGRLIRDGGTSAQD